MRIVKTFFVLVFVLALSQSGMAQVKAGTAGASFLKLGASARGYAMADALLPIADDVSALYYNPGGLVQLDGSQFCASYLSIPAGISQGWIGFARAYPEAGMAFGASVTYLNSGWMEETTPNRPNGTGRDFNYTDLAIGLTGSKRLTNKFSVGLTLKMINESSLDFNATGWSADVGTFYNTGWRSLKMAMIISNFGPDLSFYKKDYPLPILFKFGVAMDLMGVYGDKNYIRGAFEFGHPSDNLEQVNIGFEYAFKDQFFLRLGKKINGIKRDTWSDFNDDTDSDPFLEYPLMSLDGITFGTGFKLKTGMGNLGLDLAYAPLKYLDSYSMITISLRP
jgi:hypothetical protein